MNLIKGVQRALDKRAKKHRRHAKKAAKRKQQVAMLERLDRLLGSTPNEFVSAPDINVLVNPLHVLFWSTWSDRSVKVYWSGKLRCQADNTSTRTYPNATDEQVLTALRALT